jgi:hypothetical protein
MQSPCAQTKAWTLGGEQQQQQQQQQEQEQQ